MASIKLTGDTSGEITIEAPAVAGTNTLTLPTVTGTLDNTPMFSATASAGVALPDNTAVKMVYDTEDFDTDNAYDSSTNYRFTVPTGKAGKYQVNATARMTSTASSDVGQSKLFIFKNGSAYWQAYNLHNTSYTRGVSLVANVVMDLEAGDYIEIYLVCNTVSGDDASANGSSYSNFSMYKLIG